MTQDVIRLLGNLEGMAFIAQQDAKALRTGCAKQNFFEDVARYNEENIVDIYRAIRELSEVLTNEHFTSIEEHSFKSEYCPF